MDFSYDDEQRMRFQYGMPNPDYPAPIKKKHFILDFDAYAEMLIDISELGDTLDTFHDRINSAFEQVIKDGLRKKMGVKS